MDPLSVHVRVGDPLIHFSGFVWASGLTHLPTPQASARPWPAPFLIKQLLLIKARALGACSPWSPVSAYGGTHTYQHVQQCSQSGRTKTHLRGPL